MGFQSEEEIINVEHWTSEYTFSVFFISLLYLLFVIYAPGNLCYKHGLLPHWYRINGMLQLFLLVLFIPEMLSVFVYGWTSSICETKTLYSGTLSGTVMIVFLISKIMDLMETVLLILEGRNPLFIHIFHHIVTLNYTWMCYADHSSIGRWFIICNLTAHVILYSYLSPHKFGLNPCWLLVCFSQLLQLIVMLIVCFSAKNALRNGISCDIPSGRISIDIFVISVFLVLFADFYHGKFRKFRETHDCALAKYFRLDKESDSDSDKNKRKTKNVKKQSRRREIDSLRSNRGWKTTGITPSQQEYTD